MTDLPKKKRRVNPLSIDAIDKMEPGAIIYCSTVSGFGIRHRGGGKNYFLRTRLSGRERWFAIGEHGNPYGLDEARARATAIKGDIANGKDPASERDRVRATLTVADVAQRFLVEYCGVVPASLEFLPKELADKHRGRRTDARPKVKFAASPNASVKPSTARTYRDALLDHVLPRIGKLRADAVTTGDLAKLHYELRDTSRLANFCLSVVSSMVSWGATNNIWPKGSDPTGDIKRYKEHRRERYLTADEVKKVAESIASAEAEGAFSHHVAAAIRFLLLTGLRPSEALALKWADVDEAEGKVRLPDTKTGPRFATLSTHAFAVLQATHRIDGNPHVFCGAKTGAHLTTLQQPFAIIRKRAGLEGTDDVVLYTLRHHFGTTLATSRVEVYELMRMMGHKNASTSLRYIHLADAGLQATSSKATAGIADALTASTQKQAGVESPAGRVVQLKRPQRT